MTIQYYLNAKCDRIFYTSNENITFHVWVKNNSNYDIRITNFMLEFHDGYQLSLPDLDFILYPNSDNILSSSSIIQINSQYGNKKFRLNYNIYLFNNDWYLHKTVKSNEEFFINIVSKRELSSGRFIVFLSRGRLGQDRIIGDIIKARLKEWNIDTKTVGIDIESSDEQTLQIIKKEISESHGLIAIATPRNYNIITQTWQTLEWLHAELGIAFAINKPLLIIKENDTELRGLPSYLVNYTNIPSFSYNRNDIQNLIINIDNCMPFFREWLKK